MTNWEPNKRKLYLGVLGERLRQGDFWLICIYVASIASDNTIIKDNSVHMLEDTTINNQQVDFWWQILGGIQKLLHIGMEHCC